jgi:hypothetical protein
MIDKSRITQAEEVGHATLESKGHLADDTQDQRDHYYGVSHASLLRPFLRSPIIALGVHWIFQGIVYMDRTERWFKIGIEVVFFGLGLVFALVAKLHIVWSALAALLIAHTLNFVLNGQIWVVMKHFGLVKHSRQEFESYLSRLSSRVRDTTSVSRAIVYGSLTRGEWSPTSDLDIRLIREPRLLNGLSACWFALRERAWAFFQRFPLNIYVLDDLGRLEDMRADEKPFLI